MRGVSGFGTGVPQRLRGLSRWVFHQHTQAWAYWPERHGALLAEWEGPLWDHKNR